ncbi:hypothetical protein L9F63_007751, partial [Diploptera punctata]
NTLGLLCMIKYKDADCRYVNVNHCQASIEKIMMPSMPLTTNKVFFYQDVVSQECCHLSTTALSSVVLRRESVSCSPLPSPSMNAGLLEPCMSAGGHTFEDEGASLPMSSLYFGGVLGTRVRQRRLDHEPLYRVDKTVRHRILWS